MTFKEFIQGDKKSINEILKCKNIDEFKKIMDKNHIDYNSEEDLTQSWSYVKSQAAEKESGLSDDALGSVAGGAVVDTNIGAATAVNSKDVITNIKAKAQKNLTVDFKL